MLRGDAALLSTLPVEMLHRIFDELDATIIIFSVRDVCRSIRAAVDSYNRYALDFTSVSKPDFDRILYLVRPECVTALSLSNRESIPGQIDRFLSLVDIDLFTRLRSLTLLGISQPLLQVYLRHAKRCALTSLTLRHCVKLRTPLDKQEIIEHLAPIIVQPTLLHLELLSAHLSVLMNRLELSSRSQIRSLTVACDSQLRLSKFLDRSPDLKTLVLHYFWQSISFMNAVSQQEFSALYPRLTSLTISYTNRLPNSARSLLSHTPSLTYLKITGTCDSIIDGSIWEELIKTKLLVLNKFEFHQISRYNQSNRESSETLLNQVIASFRTPFWREEKRWLVICTWHPDDPSIEIYTSLVCTPNYLPSWHPNTITVTNFDTQDQSYTSYEDVLRLQIVSCRPNHSDNTVSNVNDLEPSAPSDTNLFSVQNQPVDSDLFPNETDLFIAFDRRNSFEPVPTDVNLLNARKLSLSLSCMCPANKVILNGLRSLLRKTPNIHSLEFCERLTRDMDQRLIEQIGLLVVRYVDPSKLRHLTIPVVDLTHVEQLLNGFEDLLSIKFDIHGTQMDYDVIVKHLRTSTSDYSIEQDDSSFFIKVYRRLKTTNSLKRMKVDYSSGDSELDLKRTRKDWFTSYAERTKYFECKWVDPSHYHTMTAIITWSSFWNR